MAHRAGFILLGDVHRRRFRGALLARRLAFISARSDGHGGGNRIGILVGRAGFDFAGVGPLLRSEMVRSGFRLRKLVPNPGYSLMVLVEPPREIVARSGSAHRLDALLRAASPPSKTRSGAHGTPLVCGRRTPR